MKATKRKYLDKKYLHDIDKWEEDTRNRVNTAASIASSGIGALSGATLSRNIKSKPGRAAAILLPAYAMGTGGYVISDKSAGDYIKKVADWRRSHYNDESKSGKQEMRQIKRWITHEDKADKRMKSLEKKFSDDDKVYKDSGKKYLIAPSVLGTGGVALGIGLDDRVKEKIKKETYDDAFIKSQGIKPYTVKEKLKNKVRKEVGETLKDIGPLKSQGEKLLKKVESVKNPHREAKKRLVTKILEENPRATKEEVQKKYNEFFQKNIFNRNKAKVAKRVRNSRVLVPLALGTTGAMIGSSLINRAIRGSKELDDEYQNDI